MELLHFEDKQPSPKENTAQVKSEIQKSSFENWMKNKEQDEAIWTKYTNKPNFIAVETDIIHIFP